MKIGVIVEGNDDAAFLEEIKEKLGEKWKKLVYVSNMKGKILNEKEIGKQINKLRDEYHCEKIVVLVDTDGKKGNYSCLCQCLHRIVDTWMF